MLTIGVLILGLTGGAYLKEQEIKETRPIVVEQRVPTLIEQSIEACDNNVESYTNRGLTFKCIIWKDKK